MRRFDIGWGWTKGFRFLSQRGEMNVRILVGMGIVLPSILQLLIAIGPLGGSGVAGASPPLVVAGLFVIGIGTYMLQLGSVFASWSLGFHPGEEAGAAIGYGLVTAFVTMLVVGALAVVVAVAGRSASVPGLVIGFLVLLPLLALLLALYTALASTLLIGLAGLLLLAHQARDAVARISPELVMTDGSRLALLLLPLALLFWLVARLSCTTAIMADRTRLTPFASMAESWRLTRRDQWRIIGFLVVAGVATCLVLAALAGILGLGPLSRFHPVAQPAGIRGTWWIANLIIAVPFAFLTVLLPAGIYRELRPFVPEEEVFA